MEIKLVGSTKDIKTKKEALEFGRAAARVCYSKHDFSTLVEEDDKADLINRTLASGHQSVFDHVFLSFYFMGLPKFGAMILNNEKAYTTSEKSARYTKMELHGKQEELYEKWKKIFQMRIKKEYGDILDDQKALKLAQENARYLTSVFTPTKMLHTLSFRQLNYFTHWFDDFMQKAPDTKFNTRVKQFMEQFNHILKETWHVEELDPKMKKRRLSIFAKDDDSVEEFFGETYSTTYQASFAQLAQAHRHRTLDYEIVDFQESKEYFVPPILKFDPWLVEMWLNDMKGFADDFPQGTLIKVHETGNYRDFISKMNERLCGHAQWEIMKQTEKTLEKYLTNIKETDSTVYQALLPWSRGPRCVAPKVSCNGKCPFGSKLGLERLV